MSSRNLSLDLRERVVAAVSSCLSRRQAAERFSVSPASTVRWCALAATTGRTAAKLRRAVRARGISPITTRPSSFSS